MSDHDEQRDWLAFSLAERRALIAWVEGEHDRRPPDAILRAKLRRSEFPDRAESRIKRANEIEARRRAWAERGREWPSFAPRSSCTCLACVTTEFAMAWAFGEWPERPPDRELRSVLARIAQGEVLQESLRKARAAAATANRRRERHDLG